MNRQYHLICNSRVKQTCIHHEQIIKIIFHPNIYMFTWSIGWCILFMLTFNFAVVEVYHILCLLDYFFIIVYIYV